MKRHAQTTGVRQWAGGDLVDLQAEPLRVLDAYFEEHGPCIIRGCTVITSGDDKSITPGLVALQGIDHEGKATFKVAPFTGADNVMFPVYLTLSFTVVERAYTDRKVKPIAYNYTAVASLVKPGAGIPFMEITGEGGTRFVDAVGISSKLERTGDGKDVTVSFSPAANRVNVTSGDKLSTLWGKVSGWFTDLKAVAFSGKAADITEDTTRRFMTDTERTKLNGVETGANKYTHPTTHPADMISDTLTRVSMTKAERDKLAGMETGANAYIHPANHPATVVTEDATHRFMTDTERTKLNGIDTGANKYIHPATHPADMITDTATRVSMTKAERDKLTGVEAGANAYVHPATHPASVITEDTTHRFMTDTERTKLNGIDTGANKYVHPATHPADMITDTATKVSMTKAERDKLTGVAQGANNYSHPATHPADVITDTATKVIMTVAERTKLTGVAANANAYTHPENHPAMMISEDAAHRFVTDPEKQGWNGKAEGNHNHAGVYQPAGSYSVAGHGHGATEITPDATHRFVTDTEKQGWSGKAEGNHNHNTVYAGINHAHDATYAPKSHNHAGVYQPAGSYSMVGHGHGATEITPDATHRFVTDAEKQGWNGKAAGNHDHVGVYQPAGSYSPAGHGHNASEITQDSIRRFVTDAEKTAWNGKIEFFCAGLITGTAGKEGYWGENFSVFKNSTGYYRVKHELNKACQVLAMCINAAGQEGFASIPYRSNTDFYVSTNGTNGRQDMAFFFMIFTL